MSYRAQLERHFAKGLDMAALRVSGLDGEAFDRELQDLAALFFLHYIEHVKRPLAGDEIEGLGNAFLAAVRARVERQPPPGLA